MQIIFIIFCNFKLDLRQIFDFHPCRCKHLLTEYTQEVLEIRNLQQLVSKELSERELTERKA